MDRFVHLRKTELFASLSDDELADLERRLPMRQVGAGAVEVEPAGSLHVVKQGRVRVFRQSPGGREVTIAVCGRDDVFGSLLSERARHSLVEAETDALLCRLDERRLRALARTHPEVAVALVRALGRQLAAREELVTDLAFRSAEQRVARVVLRMVAAADGRRLRVSHAEVARAAGVVRETATKALGRMEGDGLLALGYRSVTVLDAGRLARRAAAPRTGGSGGSQGRSRW